jgi:hypothetical protein
MRSAYSSAGVNSLQKIALARSLSLSLAIFSDHEHLTTSISTFFIKDTIRLYHNSLLLSG